MFAFNWSANFHSSIHFLWWWQWSWFSSDYIPITAQWQQTSDDDRVPIDQVTDLCMIRLALGLLDDWVCISHHLVIWIPWFEYFRLYEYQWHHDAVIFLLAASLNLHDKDPTLIHELRKVSLYDISTHTRLSPSGHEWPLVSIIQCV